MTDNRQKSARDIAIDVLNRCDPKRDYIGPILNKLLSQTDQKQRATDLVLGTIRNRSAIDTVITEFTGRPIERIPDKLLNIIRIAIYELIYSPTTGQHAIVNEAVENATGYSSVSSITDSAANGDFSFNIVIDVEYIDFTHGNMTGTTTLDYSSSYDDDGVLNTWELSRTSSVSNENHSITNVYTQSFSRVTGRGDSVIFDTSLTTTLLIVGGVGVGCLIVGFILGRKY